VRRRRALQVEIAMAPMAWFVRISDAAMGGGEGAKKQAVVLHAQPKSGYPLQNSTDHRWAVLSVLRMLSLLSCLKFSGPQQRTSGGTTAQQL
jgi:hypothetical protein